MFAKSAGSSSQLEGKRCLIDSGNALAGGASDVVAVRQDDGGLKATAFHAFVGKFDSLHSLFLSRNGRKAIISVNGQQIGGITIGGSGAACFSNSENLFSSTQLENMNLEDGINNANLLVDDLGVTVPFSIFLFDGSSKLIVTDIDGTITKSDWMGIAGNIFGFDVFHDGVAEYLSKAATHGYKIVHLTARPVALDDFTRSYLFKKRRYYHFPTWPVFLNPTVMMKAVQMRSDAAATAQRKTATLQNLVDLFNGGSSVVYKAYGNQDTDTKAYVNVGIPQDKIYTINEESEMKNVGTGKATSYREQAELIDIRSSI